MSSPGVFKSRQTFLNGSLAAVVFNAKKTVSDRKLMVLWIAYLAVTIPAGH